MVGAQAARKAQRARIRRSLRTRAQQQPRRPPPPPQSPPPKTPQWFDSIDADRSGRLDARELQRALALGNLNFDASVCAAMVRAFASGGARTLAFDEFSRLHHFLVNVQKSFSEADRDRSGRLSLVRTGGLHMRGAPAMAARARTPRFLGLCAMMLNAPRAQCKQNKTKQHKTQQDQVTAAVKQAGFTLDGPAVAAMVDVSGGRKGGGRGPPHAQRPCIGLVCDAPARPLVC